MQNWDVFQQFQEAKVNLNSKKCEFGVQYVHFLGYVVDIESIHLPEKEKATEKFLIPKYVTEVCQFLGMVNFLGCFLPCLSDLTNILLRSNNALVWSPSQEKSFSGHLWYQLQFWSLFIQRGKLSFQQMPHLIDLGKYYHNVKRMTNLIQLFVFVSRILSASEKCDAPDWKKRQWKSHGHMNVCKIF